ncbi:MAG: hypothetical protein GY810_14965, partial [Aureispira sp.]|nr:hypothetical protein [Aureispira sp.]
MKKSILFSVSVILLLSSLACDKLQNPNNGNNSSSNTPTEELEAYFNSSNNTLNLYSEDLMRAIQSTTGESPQYAPFLSAAQEADALLSGTEKLAMDIYTELSSGNSESRVKELMLAGGEAENLFSSLLHTQSSLIEILNNMVQNNPRISNTDERELKKFAGTLPLMNEDLWAEDDQPAQFTGLSLHAAKRKLLKIQHNVIQTRAVFYRFLNEKMVKKELNYDKFDVLVNSEKDYVLLGESYTSEISLGAYSSQAKFSVSVNGKSLPIKDGKAIYTTRGSRVGEQKYTARISVNNPLTGETETFTKDFFYEIGQPYVSVSADNMNILKIGEDNPVTIATAGISSQSLSVSISGGGGTIKKLGKTGYMVKVIKPGKVV